MEAVLGHDVHRAANLDVPLSHLTGDEESLCCRQSTWPDIQLQATRPERRAKTCLQDVLLVNAGLPPKK